MKLMVHLFHVLNSHFSTMPRYSFPFYGTFKTSHRWNNWSDHVCEWIMISSKYAAENCWDCHRTMSMNLSDVSGVPWSLKGRPWYCQWSLLYVLNVVMCFACGVRATGQYPFVRLKVAMKWSLPRCSTRSSIL